MWKPIILDVECIVCNKLLHQIEHSPQDLIEMGKVTNTSTNRRLRTPNWSAIEKQYLLELIKARKDVVVIKANNGPIFSEEKDIAWNEILTELGVKFGSKFIGSSIKKVKTQWQNMKRIAREEIAANGPNINTLTKQTLEVCYINDMIKDGVLRLDWIDPALNETLLSTSNVEIKTERIDEDINQPGCSDIDINHSVINLDDKINEKENLNMHNQIESSASSASEHIADNNEFETRTEMQQQDLIAKNTVTTVDRSSMTDPIINFNPFHEELKDYFRFVGTERLMKIETIKEERHVAKTMRETAELNKIIAEQKLKHVLWLKKQEMTMYSGELGSGAGRGGGGGGSIREAGGSFGKMEAAREEEFFYKQQKEQLKNLKVHLDKEIEFHQQQIKQHEDAIKRHKNQLGNIEKK